MKTGISVLCVVTLAAAAAVHPGAALADGPFDQKVAADPKGTVDISSVSGRIEVSGWDKPEVQVRADNLPSGDRIEVNSDHGRIVIKVIATSHLALFSNGSVTLSVRVPRGSELNVTGTSADIAENDVEGSLQLHSVSGDIKADFFGRDAEIKSVSGDIVIRGKGQNASAHVSTVSGNVRIDRLGGDLDVATTSGDMVVEVDPTRSVRARSTSGDFGLQGKLSKAATVDVESVSGDVSVRTGAESGMEYEVSSFSGDIRNCMGAESKKVSQYGPGSRLQGSHAGAAGSDPARVRVKTMSGDVELCDHR